MKYDLSEMIKLIKNSEVDYPKFFNGRNVLKEKIETIFNKLIQPNDLKYFKSNRIK